MDRVVVVGASLAGVRAVEALRREGFSGEVTLVGDEPHLPPFDRPPLSKQILQGTWELEQSRLKMHGDLDAVVDVGHRATRLDAHERAVELDDGRRVFFDGLVIATGARPRLLPGVERAIEGVHVLRRIEDALALREAVAQADHVVVVGAGWLGLEVAASCRALGVAVTVVEFAEQPLAEALGPEMGAWAADVHTHNGVKFRLGELVEQLRSDCGAMVDVRMSDGTELHADVVLVAIGVEPEVDWLVGAGLDLADGVGCDEYGQVRGLDRAVAAGDVARWFHPLFGRSIRVEHWTNAAEQGDYAARSLLADPGRLPGFASVPYVWSDQYDWKLQYVGIPGRFAGVVEGSVRERRFVAGYVEGEYLVGALCVNAPQRMGRYRRHIAAVAAGEEHALCPA